MLLCLVYALFVTINKDESEHVSPPETHTLKGKSDYFQAMPEANTIRKPTEHIVSLICKSQITVKSLEEMKVVLEAANEILFTLTRKRMFGHNGI